MLSNNNVDFWSPQTPRCRLSVSSPVSPIIAAHLIVETGKANDVLEKLHDKKQKVNADIEQTGFVDEEMLQQMSKEELVETVRSLQTALLEAKANSSNQKDLPEALWTPEKVKERATKAKDIARKEIKKQMKWQPSCKQGLTKWSYTGVVPHEDVFKKMFAVGAKDKPWKQKKISRGEFIELFGDIEASVSASKDKCLFPPRSQHADPLQYSQHHRQRRECQMGSK